MGDFGEWLVAGVSSHSGQGEQLRWSADPNRAKLGHRDRRFRMADNESPAEADEVLADDNDELEEADEESFPASDPPATWSGPEE